MKPLITYDSNPGFPEIRKAGTAQELREARISAQNKLLEIKNGAELALWITLVNRMHDEVGQRAVWLCEREMNEAGFGQPPARYAFVAFGSCGRQEATLWSDQDNGLIIGDEPEGNALMYFRRFGTRLSNMLETAGYPKCKGKVMCSEPAWNMKISEWERQLKEWSADHAWEPTRHMIIASDMRHVAGSRELSEAWARHFHSCVLNNTDILPALLRNTVRHKATLNLMGQIVTERFGEHAGDFDVKYGAYIPLVNSIRTMALERGIAETSTLRRLERIIMLEGGSLLLENAQHAFMLALKMRNDTPLRFQNGLVGSSDYLPKEQLKNKKVLYELRDTLGVVRRIHRAMLRELRMAERKGH